MDSLDYDAQKDKDDEMLADYYSDLATEEMQASCLHEEIFVENSRVIVSIPKGAFGAFAIPKKEGDSIVSEYYDVEANFVCYKCNKSRWVSINVDEYIDAIDDPHVLDD
tara:strand:- start:2139 stop:2465 length:327 start_codon:yes stop_codon:yes gene_type:complete